MKECLVGGERWVNFQVSGVASLRCFQRRHRIPSVKDDLVWTQRWKLFDLTETERVQVRELQELSKETYHGINEVTEKR